MKTNNNNNSSSNVKLVYLRLILVTWGIFAVVVLFQQSFHVFHLSTRFDTSSSIDIIQPCTNMVVDDMGVFLLESPANVIDNDDSYYYSNHRSTSSSSFESQKIHTTQSAAAVDATSPAPTPPAAAAAATSTTASTPRRYAVAQFIDNPRHLYGLYSIQTQMERFNMTSTTAGANKGGDGLGLGTVGLVAVVPMEFPLRHPKAWKVLNQLLLPTRNNSISQRNDTSSSTTTTTPVGHHQDNSNSNNNNRIYQVDIQSIHGLLDKSLWRGTFNKLWLFNVTDYDKLIVLDCDVLIRQSLLHWFDLSTPAATQPVGAITWNSGAMVIQPNATIFRQMLEVLPKVKAPPSTVFNNDNTGKNKTKQKKKQKKDDGGEEDNWNTWISDQGFLSAFFSSEQYGGNDPTQRMKTLPIEASVLSKSLIQPNFKYWLKFRRHIIQTIHFTQHKPWRKETAPKDDILCDMLLEWRHSLEGIERYYPGIPPLEGDCLRNCKKNPK